MLLVIARYIGSSRQSAPIIRPRRSATGRHAMVRGRSEYHLAMQHTRHRRVVVEQSVLLRDGCQRELILRATWSAQPQTTQPQDAFEMCKQHLIALSVMASLSRYGNRRQWRDLYPIRPSSLLQHRNKFRCQGPTCITKISAIGSKRLGLA